MKQPEDRLLSHFSYIWKNFSFLQAVKTSFIPRFLPFISSKYDYNELFVNSILSFQRKIVTNIIEKYKNTSISESARIPDDYIIWYFWWQGKQAMPQIIKECYNSIERNRQGHKICFIDKSNYKEYVDIPDYILEKFERGVISTSHFSDIIRLLLLSKYGGWWIDAAMYVIKPYKLTGCLFMPAFQTGIKSLCQGRWCFGCFASAPGFKLVDYMIESLFEYWRLYDTPITYLLFDGFMRIAYEEFPDVAQKIDLFPKCSPYLHSARYTFNQEVNWEHFGKIINENYFLSLTWRNPFNERTDKGQYTYYGALISMEGNEHENKQAFKDI